VVGVEKLHARSPSTSLRAGFRPAMKVRALRMTGWLGVRRAVELCSTGQMGTSAPTQAGLHEQPLHLLAGFAEDDLHLQFFLAAIEGDADGVPGAVVVHDVTEVLFFLHVLAIDGND